MNELSLHQWCALIRDRRWTTRQKHLLLERIGTPASILDASREHIQAVIGPIKNWSHGPAPAHALTADLAWLEQPHHFLIDRYHAGFPSALKQIADPPIALFGIGNLACLDAPKVAIVGSRRPTPVGQRVVASIAADLAMLGVTVISGMAMGIDGLAHQSALHTQSPSIAVLGSGLDRPSPARHTKLFEQLCEHGLVLSEYPLGANATRYSFPERNRLVSGLSLGVVIVEAAARSGTLITARHATEQSRDVMVVPGSALSAQYAGSHRLIQQGAALVQNAQDILNCLAMELSQSIPKKSVSSAVEPCLSADCIGLLSFINPDGSAVNDIMLESGLTATKVSSMLITLELAGAVAVDVNGRYINLS